MTLAIERIREVTAAMNLASFEQDWRSRLIVERCLQIISEPSRSLPNDLKSRHAHIPWPRIAAIGNRLRHEYDDILPDILWTIVSDNISALEQVCKEEFAPEQRREARRQQARETTRRHRP
jgi:uncharacterized protein with HEPN domain